MSNPKAYEREKNGKRFRLKGGMNTVLPADALPEGEFPYLQNIRAYLGDRITGRNTQSTAIDTLDTPPHSIKRLNDTTPAGPGSGFTLISGTDSGKVYANTTSVVTGLSGNPVSILPFRPNTSVQPWAYIGDSAPSPNVTVSSSFSCAGMVKVRSDGLSRKMGIAEPQISPTVTFPGGGTGPSQIFYRYVYRASETGALSNPSPDSIPGTNSQSSPSASLPATTFATNYTFNASQYEFVGTQLRTKGGVPAGTVTDYMIAHGFGFSIPAGVTIQGVQIDLNWVGQNTGTGVLSGAALYYLGAQLGNPKFPGIQNQSFSIDTFQGGSGDTWGAALTPAIINDPSFGFGVQITTQSAGGSDRSFVNFMRVTIYYSTQNANITPTPSSDPQVDKIDFYRQGGGLANFTYVGTGPNSATVFNDILSDLGAAANPILQFDNFEPFPSIDLPRKGTLNASGGTLTRVTGDFFNPRWLPGTIMLIGSPNQVAYTLIARPTTTTNLVLPGVPDGVGLVWNIAEPILAAQPLPSMWGPTDNTAYMFGCFDPLRPGTLYYTKGNNPDSAPDTNQIEVTSPSEPLMNGYIIGGIGQVFSTERAWWIYPTFTTALATVSGVSGQAFNLIEAVNDRGLYIRNCICTEAGKNGFFRAKDGIYISPSGQGSKSITDTIYNLFPHEQATGTTTPGPVIIGPYTVYPPDDTRPEKQKLSFVYGYLYYDYQDVNGNPRTLVYDVAAKGWSVDVYGDPVTVHAPVEGKGANGTYVGCSSGAIRTLAAGATETATSVVATSADNAGDTRAFKRVGDVFIKALVAASNPITVALYANRFGLTLAGFSPTSLTGTGALSPYIVDFTSGLAQDVIDIEAALSWPTASANYLDLWQPDFLPLPESTQDRPSDWGDVGGPGAMWVKGLILEADTFNVAKVITIEDESGAFHTPDQSPIILNGQQKIVLSFSTPFVTHVARIVTADGVPWRVWQIEWVSEPYAELVDDFVPPFDNLGSNDAKFVQGFLLEADTNNVSKAFKVQSGDDLSIHIPDQSPATFNGKSVKAFTFTPPLVAHSLRLLSADSTPWRRFNLKWVYLPYPEATAQWQTELISFGIEGWMHIPMINIPANPTAAITLTLVFDQWPTITVTIPATAGALTKQKIIIPPNKFKMVSFRLSSTAPFNLFEKDVEVWVGQWGRSGSYRVEKPFGGNSSPGAQV